MSVRARMHLAVRLPGAVDTTVRAGAVDTTVRAGAVDATVRAGVGSATVRPGLGSATVRPGLGNSTVRPGARGTTVRPGAGDATGPATGRRSSSPVDFASFEGLARTAERGLFDFLLLAGGRPSPDREGSVRAPDVVGRPEAITVLNALAAVTERLGLAATADAVFDEPYELARRLATLDHLSEGRAAWNVVAATDASTAENLRRGGCPDIAARYPRAAECVEAARELWDSWTPGGVSRPIAYRGRYFDIAGDFTVPRPPQGHPVVIHAGDSPEGREFAARAADVVLVEGGSGDGFPGGHGSLHGALEAGRVFRAEMKERLAAYGRSPEELKIMPVVGFVLGDTAAEARERAAESLSVRQTVIETSGRGPIVGTPEAVAAALDEGVRTGAADGFVLVPPATPGGLDEFVDRVVPLLQERGAFRTEYTGTTLRSHLGLAEPVWKG
ncbi:LLM class flavin-dependent oxidoreductase [Streptomyces sp. NPDC091209]|uniref:LLM class flavin-dependent oxidoreductase n=1 Tax=Streptomyces sp. NPDC091209 TaxID=3365974 RepID=UPI00382ACDF9